jgi:hypothetical protein
MLFYKYIHEVRAKLEAIRGTKRKGVIKEEETDAFILTMSGSPEKGEGISSYVTSFFKQLQEVQFSSLAD